MPPPINYFYMGEIGEVPVDGIWDGIWVRQTFNPPLYIYIYIIFILFLFLFFSTNLCFCIFFLVMDPKFQPCFVWVTYIGLTIIYLFI